MTIDDRDKIEDFLKQQYNFTNIGEKINYHRTSIADEINKHKIKIELNTYGTNFVNCSNLDNCEKCDGKTFRRKSKNFSPILCEDLNKPPYVCNGCPKNIIAEKIFYI